MILCAVLSRKGTGEHKHRFTWTEGEAAGHLLQYANPWWHPKYPFALFQEVLGLSVLRHEDTVMVYYWDDAQGYWRELD